MAVAAAWTSHHTGSGSWAVLGWERRAEPIIIHLPRGMNNCPLLSYWWEKAVGTCSQGTVGPALFLLILF